MVQEIEITGLDHLKQLMAELEKVEVVYEDKEGKKSLVKITTRGDLTLKKNLRGYEVKTVVKSNRQLLDFISPGISDSHRFCYNTLVKHHSSYGLAYGGLEVVMVKKKVNGVEVEEPLINESGGLIYKYRSVNESKLKKEISSLYQQGKVKKRNKEERDVYIKKIIAYRDLRNKKFSILSNKLFEVDENFVETENTNIYSTYKRVKIKTVKTETGTNKDIYEYHQVKEYKKVKNIARMYPDGYNINSLKKEIQGGQGKGVKATNLFPWYAPSLNVLSGTMQNNIHTNYKTAYKKHLEMSYGLPRYKKPWDSVNYPIDNNDNSISLQVKSGDKYFCIGFPLYNQINEIIARLKQYGDPNITYVVPKIKETSYFYFNPSSVGYGGNERYFQDLLFHSEDVNYVKYQNLYNYLLQKEKELLNYLGKNKKFNNVYVKNFVKHLHRFYHLNKKNTWVLCNKNKNYMYAVKDFIIFVITHESLSSSLVRHNRSCGNVSNKLKKKLTLSSFIEKMYNRENIKFKIYGIKGNPYEPNTYINSIEMILEKNNVRFSFTYAVDESNRKIYSDKGKAISTAIDFGGKAGNRLAILNTYEDGKEELFFKNYSDSYEELKLKLPKINKLIGLLRRDIKYYVNFIEDASHMSHFNNIINKQDYKKILQFDPVKKEFLYLDSVISRYFVKKRSDLAKKGNKDLTQDYLNRILKILSILESKKNSPLGKSRYDYALSCLVTKIAPITKRQMAIINYQIDLANAFLTKDETRYVRLSKIFEKILIRDAKKIKNKENNLRAKLKNLEKTYYIGSKTASRVKDRDIKTIVNDLVDNLKVGGFIVCEKLNLKNMLASAKGDATTPGKGVKNKKNITKGLTDTSVYKCKEIIKIKSKESKKDIRVIEVDPRNTSRYCSKCREKKNVVLTNMLFKCNSCDHSENRDFNACRNIRDKGLKSLEKV
jgi:transposase